jgi:2-pyrone-4,6-dicarboxylate lactonase
MTRDRRATYDPEPRTPGLRLPHGACDAHVHVVGPERVFAYTADPPYPPSDAPKEALFALHRKLGITRCVLVQSLAHGFDNSVIADAIACKGGEYCGIALAPPTTSDAVMQRLDMQGFRGVRFNLSMRNAGAIDDVIAMTARMAYLGWNLQVHLERGLIDEIGPRLIRSSVPVVIDHMARVDASQGLDQPSFRMLRKLLEHEHIWVKVSGCDRISTAGPPYTDAIPFARLLVEEHGDRTLWGTDWPHPNHTHVPDDAALVDLIAQIAPSAQARQALLVDNPARLYRLHH